MATTFIGFFLFPGRVHFVSNTVWMTFRFLATHYGHSGYDFPIHIFGFSWIKQNGATFHNYHHAKNNGNYGGAFQFWDDFFKTSLSYEREVLNVGGGKKDN